MNLAGILGALMLGSLGDGFGRIGPTVAGLLGMGLCGIATASVTTPFTLTIWRLLMGLCYGAVAANVLALAADLLPPRGRTLIVTLVGCSITLGGVLAGFIASPIITQYGWPGLFVAGALPCFPWP